MKNLNLKPLNNSLFTHPKCLRTLHVSSIVLDTCAAAVAAASAKSLQSCPTLCDPIDGSPPGSSIHGIFQARVLEWGAIAFAEIPVLDGVN